jgi:anti-sigma factor RsiW
MTLPFRRRHNDAEATHDRARALSSRRLLEPLDGDDEAWLNRHLDACTECRREDEAFFADRQLLRSLREKPIEPPRDLWAKTAAALDLVASRRSPPAATRPPFWRAVPLGAAAGGMVLLVVIGTVFLPGVIRPVPGATSQVAAASGEPGPTPISVAAAPIRVLRPGANDTFDFLDTDVEAVCPHARPQCLPPPAEHESSSLSLLGARASTVTLSPDSNQLVFESEGGTAAEHKILIQPVAAAGEASQPPATPTATLPDESAAPSTPPGSAGPTPGATPTGQIEIASGVTIVGDVAYSPDGKWLAFSAAPKDGSTGPDLYIYAAGDPTATPVTSDHQTYFSAWLGSKVLASHIAARAEEPQAPGNPKASNAPGASGNGNQGQGNGQGNNGQGRSMEGTASSFLFDPATGASTELGQADMWMPVVDPKGRFVTYWAGSLRSTDGVTWQLGEGQLVLDGWRAAANLPSGSAAASEAPAASADAGGPVGHPTPIVTSHVEDFVAKFDPDGIRLAVWVSESAGASDGRLHLVVIDAATGAIASQPLSGEPALRRFSIGANRLAWVSPSGQDGHESTLQVLGWSGNTFGQIESEPSADLLILR